MVANVMPLAAMTRAAAIDHHYDISETMKPYSYWSFKPASNWEVHPNIGECSPR